MKILMTTLKTAMMDSISNVLETMFFLPIEIEDADSLKSMQSQYADSILSARLNFTGPLNGSSTFHLSKELAADIAADFLGTDKSILNTDQIVGTATEIVNMIVGDLFSHYDPDAIFNLAIPYQVQAKEVLVGVDNENEITVGIRTMKDSMAFQIAIESREAICKQR